MRTIDLFCGCGGMSLGFQNAGYQIVGAFDLSLKENDRRNGIWSNDIRGCK